MSISLIPFIAAETKAGVVLSLKTFKQSHTMQPNTKRDPMTIPTMAPVDNVSGRGPTCTVDLYVAAGVGAPPRMLAEGRVVDVAGLAEVVVWTGLIVTPRPTGPAIPI